MNERPILRRCVACKKLINRKKLWKVTRDYRDGVTLETGMGRSAYLCPKESCLEEAWRRKRLQQALRCPVELSLVEVLRNKLNNGHD